MKKIKRSTKDRVLAGFFGGLGEYFDIDPIILRLIGIFVFIWSGFFAFILVYVVAIFVIPNDTAPRKEIRDNSGSKFLLWLIIIILVILVILPFLAFAGIRTYTHSQFEEIESIRVPSFEFPGIEIDRRELMPSSKLERVMEVPAVERPRIYEYLEESVISPSFDGEIFSEFSIFTKEPQKIYLWAYISEYYKEGGELEQGVATSLPLVLHAEGRDVIGHESPRDGNYYSQDVRNMFPPTYYKDVLDFQTKNREVIDHLITEVERKAQKELS